VVRAIACLLLRDRGHLAVAASCPNASPKTKGNDRRDHDRDHNCVP
jgi:hypothetical protein